MLTKNMLIKWRDTGKVYRVLDEVASRETPDNAATHFVVIARDDWRAMPEFWGKLKTLEALGDRELIILPDVPADINLDKLSKPETTLVERRWELWQRVRPWGEQLYDRHVRGNLARQLVAEKVASKPFFYMTLRLIWQRGPAKSSLTAEWKNCGGPGIKRIPKEGDLKAGRRRTIQPGQGVAATKAHRANMLRAWSKSPVGTNGKGLHGAWIWMLIVCYPEHVHLHPGDDTSVTIKNYDAVPTFEQFQYHWKQEFSFEIRQLNRLQQRMFDLAFKPLLTGTLQEVRGPGTRYYIDATVLDVYCVSRLNRRRIVGRPTLYVVVDQFSRMIVGIYIGLEPPCWVGAMLALWNCSIDKVQYCAQYGINITEDMWPTGHMPLHLMGDRGEMISGQADSLSIGFGIDVENARPFAGEAKGVGERVFGTVQTKYGPYIPGYVDKEFMGRDCEPAALRATMDITQITRAMVASVLATNMRVIREYEGWPEVIADGVPFIPVQLWHWGVQNLRCDARQYQPEHLKRYLWPSGSMKFTRKALHFFRGLYYMGMDLGAKPWFSKSLLNREEVSVLYNPLQVGKALVIPSEARAGLLEVELTRRCQRFGDVSLSEVMALSHQSRIENAKAVWENLPQRAYMEKQIHETVKEARKQMTQQDEPHVPKTQRLKNIRNNRAAEIEHMDSVALLDTFGIDPTGRMVDVQSREIPDSVDETVDTVQNLIQQRRQGTAGTDQGQ